MNGRLGLIARAGLIAIALLVSGLGPAASSAEAMQIQGLELVEVRPDKTVALTWPSAPADPGYEIGWRIAATANDPASAWSVAASANATGAASIRRVLQPGVDWPANVGVGYELAVRTTGGTWSGPAPVTLSLTPSVLTGSGASSTINLTWTPAPASEPFAAYQLFVGGPTDPIASCLLSSFADRGTVSMTATAEGTACGGEPFAAGDYTGAVRIVRNASPLVVDAFSATTLLAGGPSAVPPEKFATANVSGRWQIVDSAGQVAQWNGINLRRGELTSYAFNVGDFTSMVDQGFDTVRIVMEWSRFEPQPGVFDAASFAAVDRTVALAELAGMDVVLDPIHVAEAPDWSIPDWAWAATTNGVRNDRAVYNVIRANGTDYLRHVAQRYRSQDHVIAIDVINEPREPLDGVSLDANNALLIELYHDLIHTIRDIESDKILILEPYYGNAKITANRLSTISLSTVADPTPDPAQFTNLAWSIHDYYAGREGTAFDDGYSNSGYALRGIAPDGTRYRTEDYEGTGCYPSGPTASQCTNDTSRSAVLRPSMLNHLHAHDDAAQGAGMPLYVGEFGIPHAGAAYPGWSGGESFLSDKIAVYDQLGLSRAVWVWRNDVDPSYGLYSRASREWHPWADYASGLATDIGPPVGDVDCNATRDLVDALFILQFEVGLRFAGACPINADENLLDPSNGDVNGDGGTGILDALYITQCLVGVANPYC